MRRKLGILWTILLLGTFQLFQSSSSKETITPNPTIPQQTTQTKSETITPSASNKPIISATSQTMTVNTTPAPSTTMAVTTTEILTTQTQGHTQPTPSASTPPPATLAPTVSNGATTMNNPSNSVEKTSEQQSKVTTVSATSNPLQVTQKAQESQGTTLKTVQPTTQPLAISSQTPTNTRTGTIASQVHMQVTTSPADLKTSQSSSPTQLHRTTPEVNVTNPVSSANPERATQVVTTSSQMVITQPFSVIIKLDNTSNKDDPLVRVCLKLTESLKGNCTLNGTTTNEGFKFTSVIVKVDPSTAQKVYNDIKKTDDPKHEDIPELLPAILASCGALVFILVAFALYCTCHRRSYRKNQQQLTEELQTVENGYHDNPTLEVMEVHPEMQEKKPALNCEFNDSWIVPIDNLGKEDVHDEEDTHL